MDGLAFSDRHPPLRRADFATLAEALDYAALGPSSLGFNSASRDPAVQLSYRTLRLKARAFARHLGAAFERGTHIGLVAETSPDFVIAFMACQYAGLVPAPLGLPPTLGGRAAFAAQLRRIREAASLGAILVPAHLRPVYEEALVETGCLYPMDAADWHGQPDAHLRPWGPGDPCYLQFSSGSTSAPKGILATQSSVAANCQAITQHGLQVRADDHAVSWLPFYHDMGLVGFLIAPMLSQMPVDYLPTSEFARRPVSWLKLISRTGATLSYSPSFGYELSARRYRGEPVDLSSWRVASIGGDMVRASVLASFAERFRPAGFSASAFLASYGLAEATLAVSFAPLDQGCRTDTVDARALRFDETVRPASRQSSQKDVRTLVLCGRPVPGSEVRLSKAGRCIRADRQIGQVEVRGPGIAAGYYEASAGLVPLTDPAGWLDTGDLGYWLDGQLVITGRRKDLILFNGRNIWPQDIEWAVQESAEGQVERCVVIDAGEPSRDNRIVLLAECRDRDPDMRETLRRDIAQAARLATGAPVEVHLLAPRALPVTSSGKLSRSSARSLFLSRELQTARAGA